MKILIHYQPKARHAAFEGTRLRKTLKGQCESEEITWVDSPASEPDIAHLMSPRDEALLADMRWRHVPVIVSAFYCENDPSARFFETKAKDGTPTLSKRALRFLNHADWILVPNEELRKIAIGQGVSAPIEVAEPSVNLARFVDNAMEKDIFPRYFGIRPGQAIAVACGSYQDKTVIKRIMAIAKLCPEIQFYFFGSARGLFSTGTVAAHYNRQAPANLKFESIVEDDVYRSAQIRADYYLSLSPEHPDSVFLLEAFAAKTQVLGYGKQKKEPLLIDGKTGYLYDDVESLSEGLRSFYRGEGKSTIITAYSVAKEHALSSGAAQLRAVYEKLLENKNSKKEDIHD
jgi:hypothetical protein